MVDQMPLSGVVLEVGAQLHFRAGGEYGCAVECRKMKPQLTWSFRRYSLLSLHCTFLPFPLSSLLPSLLPIHLALVGYFLPCYGGGNENMNKIQCVVPKK